MYSSIVDKLSEYDSFKGVYHEHKDGEPFPSADILKEIIELTRSILFPGYFGKSVIDKTTIKYHIGVNTERLSLLLGEQVLSGLCFGCNDKTSFEDMKERSKLISQQFMEYLPELRRILITDIEAAYFGDPAAKSFSEIILCYPGLKAISNHRIAHKLLTLGVPLIPRMISEMAHLETGIDIHPGATIGENFSIDHGTGVVIGETAILGKNVKLYQGVTLGAKSFELDEFGNPVKDVPRHPILEDNVIVYANATILGRITIGKGAIIGGNVWVTNNVEAETKLIQKK